MTIHPLRRSHDVGHAQRALAEVVLPRLREFAIEDDAKGVYPSEGMDLLRRAGLLAAVLPPAKGGEGLGWIPSGMPMLFDVLTGIGGAHLSLARLYEGHVNAFALLWTHGDEAQRGRLVDYVSGGGVMGVWNAPSPDGPVRLVGDGQRLVLRGRKIYCSGAGDLRRPLVTAERDGELLMAWPDVSNARVDLSGWKVHGMRATMTGTVDFDGVEVRHEDLFGKHDDYHRQPAFSAGAWRFVAAQLGAAAALVDLMRDSLSAIQRDGDPHQRARLADAAMLVETARLWTWGAAKRAETVDVAVDDAIAYVGMARLTVERASMEIIDLAQRSLGLRSMMTGDPVERIARDLATYLRQPVPDAIRDGVAGRVLAKGLPLLECWAT